MSKELSSLDKPRPTFFYACCPRPRRSNCCFVESLVKAVEGRKSLNKHRSGLTLFHPGQEVICTNDDFPLLQVQNPNSQTPKRGPLYPVRSLYDTPRGYGITLVEINYAAVAPGFTEANFHEARFAPVPPYQEFSLTEVVEEALAG